METQVLNARRQYTHQRWCFSSSTKRHSRKCKLEKKKKQPNFNVRGSGTLAYFTKRKFSVKMGNVFEVILQICTLHLRYNTWLMKVILSGFKVYKKSFILGENMKKVQNFFLLVFLQYPLFSDIVSSSLLSLLVLGNSHQDNRPVSCCSTYCTDTQQKGIPCPKTACSRAETEHLCRGRETKKTKAKIQAAEGVAV